MSETNPSITASDIITEVEARMTEPNIAQATYLPWISYAYQKEYNKLITLGQHVKERLFGVKTTFNLTATVAEYALATYLPRWGGFIKGEIKYGGTGDDWVKLKFLPSLSQWVDQTNVTTNDWPKGSALMYEIKDTVGFIPTPPSTDSGTPQVSIWHLQKPVRITLSSDVIDLPYRYIYPIVNYVHAMAIIAENEDYRAAERVETRFKMELEEVSDAVLSEFSEYEESSFVQETDSMLHDDPFRY